MADDGFAVKINENDLAKLKKTLAGIKNAAPRTLARAINKTLTGMRTDATNEVGAILNVPKKRIRDGNASEKASGIKIINANWNDLNGKIYSAGKPVGLMSFSGTKQTAKGVTAKIYKGAARKLYRHAFIATAKNATNAFWREYKGPRVTFRKGFPYGRLPLKYRFPFPGGLQRLTGPRIEDIMSDPKVMKAIEEKAIVRFETNMAHELDRELKKL